jgi:hypothetical protein
MTRTATRDGVGCMKNMRRSSRTLSEADVVIGENDAVLQCTECEWLRATRLDSMFEGGAMVGAVLSVQPLSPSRAMRKGLPGVSCFPMSFRSIRIKLMGQEKIGILRCCSHVTSVRVLLW